jgi:hypothetical protein
VRVSLRMTRGRRAPRRHRCRWLALAGLLDASRPRRPRLRVGSLLGALRTPAARRLRAFPATTCRSRRPRAPHVLERPAHRPSVAAARAGSYRVTQPPERGQDAPLDRTVQESITIAAPPAQVYAAVSDVAGIGRFSPEASGATCAATGRPRRRRAPASSGTTGPARLAALVDPVHGHRGRTGSCLRLRVHFLGLPISPGATTSNRSARSRCHARHRDLGRRRSGLPGSVMVNGGVAHRGARPRRPQRAACADLERLKGRPGVCRCRAAR